jgi:pyruvate formate lyase activating enzyme
LYDSKLCKNFRDCLKVGDGAIISGKNGIEINRAAIRNPEIFRDICLSRAITVSGEEKTINEILAEIEKDLPFYKQSGGGVTLSGGEPLSQGQEIVTLLKELKQRNINVAIETSLHVPWENIDSCVSLTDTFLVDLKHTGKEKFTSFTGGDADLVLENLRSLSACHNNIIVRVPVIPGFNHTKSEINGIIDFAVSLKTIREIHFLPFHNLGEGKYEMAGLDYLYQGAPRVDAIELKAYADYAKSVGLNVSIGG